MTPTATEVRERARQTTLEYMTAAVIAAETGDRSAMIEMSEVIGEEMGLAPEHILVYVGELATFYGELLGTLYAGVVDQCNGLMAEVLPHPPVIDLGTLWRNLVAGIRAEAGRDETPPQEGASSSD